MGDVSKSKPVHFWEGKKFSLLLVCKNEAAELELVHSVFFTWTCNHCCLFTQYHFFCLSEKYLVLRSCSEGTFTTFIHSYVKQTLFKHLLCVAVSGTVPGWWDTVENKDKDSYPKDASAVWVRWGRREEDGNMKEQREITSHKHHQ